MADEQPEKLVLTEQDIDVLKKAAAELVGRGGTVGSTFSEGEGVVQDLAHAFDWLNRQAPAAQGGYLCGICTGDIVFLSEERLPAVIPDATARAIRLGPPCARCGSRRILFPREQHAPAPAAASADRPGTAE